MTKIRYPYINNPFGFKLPEPKPQIHPIINNWNDFSEKDKTILLEIKKIIISYLNDSKVFVYGSRIKGNWDETSDYDISIITNIKNTDLKNKVKNYNYPVEVDISFGNHERMVEIIES